MEKRKSSGPRAKPSGFVAFDEQKPEQTEKSVQKAALNENGAGAGVVGGSGGLAVGAVQASDVGAGRPVTVTEAAQHGVGDVMVREVLGFPVEHFPRLPVATTLHGKTKGGAAFVVTTSRAAYSAARDRGEPVFVGGELLAIAAAAQNDRMFAKHFEDAVARKKKTPDWRVTNALALGAEFVATVPLTWDFARVFARLDARLVKVEVHA